MKSTVSTLLIVVIFATKAFASSRTFICGVLDGHPTEYDAINFLNNYTSTASNASVLFKELKIPENRSLCNQASLLLQKNVIAIIEGSLSKTSTYALSEVTGIPVIRLHGNSVAFDQSEKVIDMSVGYRDYAHATLDIVNKFGWKNIVLAFEDNHWPKVSYFHLVSRRLKMNVDFVQLSKLSDSNKDPAAPILKVLDQIENFEAEIILLYANKEKIKLLLKQKSFKHRNRWILQGKVPLNISADRNNIVLALKLPYIDSSIGIKLQKAVQSNFANKDLAALAFDAAHVITQAVNKEPCSLINGSSIGPKDKVAMLSCIRKVQLDGLTGPVQFDGYGKRRGIELKILNLRNNSFDKIGTWNSTKGAVMSNDILPNIETPSNNNGLQGTKFRVVVVEDAPFVIKKKQEDGSFKYEGYCIDLLNELASILKFTYEIYPSPDGLYGAETEHGTWDGVIGELVSKREITFTKEEFSRGHHMIYNGQFTHAAKERADMVVAGITITESREKVVDFSMPFMHYTDDLLMKKQSSDRPTDLLQFMNPFHYYVWIATLTSVVVMSIAVFVINYFSPYGHKDENGKRTSGEFNFCNSVWFAVAFMLQQGTDNTPKSLSGRILTGSYWFCVLIFISTYTANLAAFLTVKNAQNPINNLEDIVKSSYDVAVLESSSQYEFFKTSQYETHKKIWHRIETEGTIVHSASQGIQWVREKDKFVFPYDGPLLRYAANQKPCDLTTVPGLATAKGLAFAFQANFPHVNDFTLAILHLHENDFLNSLRRSWWETKNQCPKEHATMLSQKRIDLMSMLGVYVVMVAGMVVAFLALTAEILWNRRQTKQIPLNKTERQANGIPQNGSEIDSTRC